MSPFPTSGLCLLLCEELERSAALSAGVSSAPGLTFPGEGADPEAQVPAWALPVPILLWPCAFHTLSANLGLESCSNHRNYSYSSSAQRNKHQPLQGRRFTSMQLVKNILWLDKEGIHSLNSLFHFAKDVSEPFLSHMYTVPCVFSACG